MSPAPINKSMDRDDLLTESARRFTRGLFELVQTLDRRRLPVTSWYGGLTHRGFEFSVAGLKALARKLLRGTRWMVDVSLLNRGGDAYEPLPEVPRDEHHPWFLYWEAWWVTANGPPLVPSDRVLDAGGTASLFTCYLASRGVEVHSVDLNPRLVAAGNQTARAMGWNMKSYCMDMCALDFEAGYFDHAYSICVFEHLESEQRQAALRELARVIKPGGILSITFDYGGPGVYLHRTGPSSEPRHLIRTPEDVERHLFSCDAYEPVGNPQFADNGKTYLIWPDDERERYSFGAVFLRRRS